MQFIRSSMYPRADAQELHNIRIDTEIILTKLLVVSFLARARNMRSSVNK